jgi:hypothetical protein
LKTIEVEQAAITLPELLRLASEDNVVLRAADGKEFLVAEMDDFSQEVALVREQPELMAFLQRPSRSSKRLSLSQVRTELGLDRR